MAETRRQPIRWMRENIFVTRDGIPYGVWNLKGLAYGLSTDAQKETVRRAHQDFLSALTGEFTIFGLVATSSPEEIMGQMLQGIENPSAAWLEECQLTYEDLDAYPAGERVYFLVAPLSRANIKDWFSNFNRSMELTVTEMLRFKTAPPSESTFMTWRNFATMIEKNIPRVFQSQKVGVTAIRWIAHHLVSRGAETSLAFKTQPVSEAGEWLNLGSALPEPLLDEGALTDLDEKLPKTKQFKRRYLKVETDVDAPPSYQQYATVGLTPQNGFQFPGGEFINFAAERDLDIDFALRITSTPAAKVKSNNRRAERNLKDQYQQRQAVGDSVVGGNSELDKSASALQEYTEALNASDREVEVASTIIFSTSGANPDDVQNDMKDLRDLYTSDEWTLDVPFGGQERLFWDFWPGTTTSAVANEFTQITTGRNFSMGIPLTNDDLGTGHGFRIGTNITTGRFSPVFMNIGEMSEQDISGSFGAVGELGSGKSVVLKTIASHSLDRGGQLIVVDRSDNQEWAALANALANTHVIDFMNPQWSLDPLKIYGPTPQGIKETLNLMTMLLNVDTTSDEGIILNAELKKIQMGELNLTSLRDLKTHLESDEIDAADATLARKIARLMDIFADLDYGGAFFNPDLPPMSFDAQAVVFCTHGMSLPSEKELENQTARQQMSIDKKVGRAAYSYLASVGTNIMYEDDTQEVLFIVDECHHMTGSPEGLEIIKHAIRVVRKHKSAVGLGSHAANELGDETLQALIPQRFIFRTRDQRLAAQNLEWLDKSYNRDEFIDLVTRDLSPLGTDGVSEHRRGECLFRDHLNRVGKMKVLIPRSSSRAEAVLSTPTKKVAA